MTTTNKNAPDWQKTNNNAPDWQKTNNNAPDWQKGPLNNDITTTSCPWETENAATAQNYWNMSGS